MFSSIRDFFIFSWYCRKYMVDCSLNRRSNPDVILQECTSPLIGNVFILYSIAENNWVMIVCSKYNKHMPNLASHTNHVDQTYLRQWVGIPGKFRWPRFQLHEGAEHEASKTKRVTKASVRLTCGSGWHMSVRHIITLLLQRCKFCSEFFKFPDEQGLHYAKWAVKCGLEKLKSAYK